MVDREVVRECRRHIAEGVVGPGAGTKEKQ